MTKNEFLIGIIKDGLQPLLNDDTLVWYTTYGSFNNGKRTGVIVSLPTNVGEEGRRDDGTHKDKECRALAQIHLKMNVGNDPKKEGLLGKKYNELAELIEYNVEENFKDVSFDGNLYKIDVQQPSMFNSHRAFEDGDSQGEAFLMVTIPYDQRRKKRENN
jgi:hypothetical protein